MLFTKLDAHNSKCNQPQTSTITCSYSANAEHNVSQVLRFFIFLCHKEKKKERKKIIRILLVTYNLPLTLVSIS